LVLDTQGELSGGVTKFVGAGLSFAAECNNDDRWRRGNPFGTAFAGGCAHMQSRNLFELGRVGGTIALPEILRDLGADPNAIISAAGLSAEIFADPENVIPIMSLGHLLAKSVKATQCEHIGLLLGQASSISSLGYLGLLVQNSSDVRTALYNLIRYFHIHDARGLPILKFSRDSASLGYTIFENPVAGTLDIVDATIASLFNVMRRLCGSSWQPIEVGLPRPKPRNTQPFDSFFNVSVRFDAEHGVLMFSADWLAQPLSEANPLLRQLVEDHIRNFEAKIGEGLEVQLHRLLRMLVLTGQCSFESAGQVFKLEPRTLARQLKQEHIQFRELVEQARYEVARHFLADTSLTMMRIAARLGYSEASAFSRAFHRWSGKAPAAWRHAEVLAHAETALRH
jgi:AraC-like DNA-binding protein